MINTGKVIALGFFDGVHKGHAALLDRVSSIAADTGLAPAVMSFDIHPDKLVFGTDVPLICDNNEKKRIIRELFNINDVIFIRFTKELMNMEPDDFLRLLVSEYNVKYIVVGHDYTYGRYGRGNASALAEFCSSNGLGCEIIPPVTSDGKIISSTLIRSLLEEGQIENAIRCLGHDYTLTGIVAHGLHNGTEIGFPTANIQLPDGLCIPRFGVYAGYVRTEDNRVYNAAVDIGVKPTVHTDGEVLAESHLLDFEGDIYGKTIRVSLVRFIRPEVCFENFEKLRQQIECDISRVREILTQHL